MGVVGEERPQTVHLYKASRGASSAALTSAGEGRDLRV